MAELVIHTKKAKEVVDITAEVQLAVQEAGAQEGLCHLFCLHTSAALIAADLDEGTDLDLLDAFQAMVPSLAYRHPHNPAHVPDHVMAAILGPSLCMPIEEGKLALGVWQRLCLVELGGPRERSIAVTITP